MTSGSGSDEALISLKIPYYQIENSKSLSPPISLFQFTASSLHGLLQMANGASLTCTGFLEYGLIAKKSNWNVKWGTRLSSRSSSSSFRVVAVQESEGPRRLVDIIRIIPDVSRNYFRSPSRRALFGGISLLGGFYVAQTISLSFGALGVNDVIAAVLCVLITEYVTRFYYSRPKITFPVALLNNFKMGFTYGLFIDAFKLAS
ncbi:ycf20-like protein [Salvia splendens]|uniref:ycf20-like protein n=1 Tax=Salvia splendens TaxID=180675 RepID=UPI001C2608B8|nr:ycf20-like protein [Salvia splendens]